MSLIFAVVLAVTAVASPVEQKFVDGETLDYNLAWLKITGGTARMTIQPVGDSYRITSVAKSSPSFSRFFRVHDEIETTVTRDGFSTTRYVKRLDEDGDKMEEITTIQDGIASRKRKKVRTVRVPHPVHDPISLIYQLRTRDLSPGKSYEFDVIADGKLYSVHARVVRRERVETPAGTFDCVRVEPRMVGGGIERQERLYLWYTDDERKLPVRIRTEIKVGAITATLRGTSAGVSSPDPPALAEAQK